MDAPQFHLIMAHEDSQWNIPVGQMGTDTFPLARVLEYTPSYIEQLFRPLDQNLLKRMTTFPALFLSELKWDEQSDVYFMTAKVGRVSYLSKIQKELEYKFEITENFGRIEIGDTNDRKVFAGILGVNNGELHRTHWAIKDYDFHATVAGLKKWIESTSANPEVADVGVSEIFTNVVEISEPTVPEAVDNHVVEFPSQNEAQAADTVEGFLTLVLQNSAAADEEIYFRGHSDKKYRLVPTLLRTDELGNYLHLQNEDRMFSELECAHPSEFAADRYVFERLVRMQHFGLPTRLLDVTANPLVALFFCCQKRNDGVEGEVVLFRPQRNSIQFYDSGLVSCLSNLARLPYRSKELLKLNASMEEFNVSDSRRELLAQIGNDKPHFRDLIDPLDLQRVLFVKGRNSNPRIAFQVGSFLLFGHDAFLDEDNNDLGVTRITIRNKSHIMDQLERLNIKKSTVYPSLENSAIEIARRYQFLEPPPESQTSVA